MVRCLYSLNSTSLDGLQLLIDSILGLTREVDAKSGMVFPLSPKDDARLPKKLYSTTTSRSLLTQQVFKDLMQKRGPRTL